jgi:hypothetical protein
MPAGGNPAEVKIREGSGASDGVQKFFNKAWEFMEPEQAFLEAGDRMPAKHAWKPDNSQYASVS